MLEIRPNCELCDRDLPPASSAARICTYECTFCADCVATVLHNVCPNCGGGFEKRPIRPVTAGRKGVSLEHQPAASTRVHSPYSRAQIEAFVSQIKSLAPGER